ncbi:MAG TPA: gluconate 2-dehydrogenase subunit 3 family protein, partial [Candidatus Dormibacteraeota bacterium]|nr:gluconate 2-dehydrogenase subunit 3 family protein [Candidatus Dormibacteraeota bacterium]
PLRTRQPLANEETATFQDIPAGHVPDPGDAITRREALRQATLLLGGTLAAPIAAGILAACEARRVPADRWRPKALSADQAELLAAIVDHILPATDTPGARALGVHQFIDAFVAETYPPDARAWFLAGLDQIDARSREQDGQTFLQRTASAQRALLEQIDCAAFAPTPTHTPAPSQPSFYRTLKRLTLIGYYISEIGATRELHHVPVPGHYDGCVPLVQVGRTWAL